MDNGSRESAVCNYCNEHIQAGSRRCPYCGSLIKPMVEQDDIKVEEPENFINSRPQSISLSNGSKVLITIISTTIPCLGQLIGMILAVLFINSEEDDKKSFGLVLLIAVLIFFVFWCIMIFISAIILAMGYQ